MARRAALGGDCDIEPQRCSELDEGVEVDELRAVYAEVAADW